MKGPMLCPFWASVPKVRQAVELGGIKTVLIPRLDERVGHKTSPGGVFWGNPASAATLARSLKGRCETYLWVPWLHWWRAVPAQAQWVDSRGRSYSGTPCPASEHQIERMKRFLAIAKQYGCRGVVMDAENYVGRFATFGGSQPRGGTFGQRTRPSCYCKRHAPEATWTKISPLLRRMYGQAFYPYSWVVQQFGGLFNEDYKDFDSSRQVKEIDKTARHGAYGGVWLSAMRTPERALDFVRRAVGVYGTRWWIWEEEWLQANTPLDAAWWKQFREIAHAGR